MPTDYKCIFGISKSTSGIPQYSMNRVANKHRSYLVVTGPDYKVYWFLFVNVGKTCYGSDPPRYSEKDEAAVAQEYQHDNITEKCTFGDLYASRTVSVLTALPEYVFKKWHFKRIITIGDSAHKVGLIRDSPSTVIPPGLSLTCLSSGPYWAKEETALSNLRLFLLMA